MSAPRTPPVAALLVHYSTGTLQYWYTTLLVHYSNALLVPRLNYSHIKIVTHLYSDLHSLFHECLVLR